MFHEQVGFWLIGFAINSVGSARSPTRPRGGRQQRQRGHERGWWLIDCQRHRPDTRDAARPLCFGPARYVILFMWIP